MTERELIAELIGLQKENRRLKNQLEHYKNSLDLLSKPDWMEWEPGQSLKIVQEDSKHFGETAKLLGFEWNPSGQCLLRVSVLTTIFRVERLYAPDQLNLVTQEETQEITQEITQEETQEITQEITQEVAEDVSDKSKEIRLLISKIQKAPDVIKKTLIRKLEYTYTQSEILQAYQPNQVPSY